MGLYLLRRRRAGAFLITAYLLVGCATTADRQAEEQRVQAESRDAYRETLRAAHIQKRLNVDPTQQERLALITNRLTRETDIFHPGASRWDWQVNIIEAPEVNAFCLPGGKIILYSGLLKEIKPTDDELAAILSHEMAHALKGHGQNRLQTQKSLKQVSRIGVSALVLAGLPAEGINPLLKGGNDLSQVITAVSFGPSQEYEADELGMNLMKRANFNPQAMIKLWEKLAQHHRDGQNPGLLATHPSDENRRKRLEEILAR